MTVRDSLDHLQTGTWLRDNPVAAHLGSDEGTEYVLTNRQVGLTREADGEERRISPAEDCGAVAVLTDRRVLFLVGDPRERQGDLAESVPYEAIVAAVAETETLTQRVVVETDDATYAFTARETDVVDDVQSFLETAAAVYADCQDHFSAVAAASDRLEAAIDDDDWEGCEDAIGDARVTLSDARGRIEGTSFDPLRERVDDLEAEIDDLARIRHCKQATQLAEESEALLTEHAYQDSHRRLQAAREHVDAADRLADATAAADGGTDGGVAVAEARDRIEDLATTITARPLTDGEEAYRRASETDDRAERIDALESAFECYRAAAALLADDDSPFEGDQRAAREDAERVIADLVEAHADAAAADRAAGEWERDVENLRSAYEVLTDAKDHGERALELARAYPPGDVASIEAELETIESLLDPLRIEVELTEAEGSEA